MIIVYDLSTENVGSEVYTQDRTFSTNNFKLSANDRILSARIVYFLIVYFKIVCFTGSYILLFMIVHCILYELIDQWPIRYDS